MRCHHLDQGVLSCLPPKVSAENHIGKSRETESESFLEAENIIASLLHFSETWILISEHFFSSINIYLVGETFSSSAASHFPQLAMPLSVLTASLGKNLFSAKCCNSSASDV